MDNAMIWEWVGYIASVLVAVSLMMTDIKKLRWWNTAGCATFSAYGFAISAYPVALLNGFIVLVNIYYLWRIYRFEQSD